jgi:LysM repeat protein
MSVFSQKDTLETELIAGKKYYIHIVQAGNSLWGIHKLYNVSVNEIVAANPGIENGIKVGQKISVPVPIEVKYHEVIAGETLYAVAKKYGVKTDDLIAANPGTENGIVKGQKIIIPITEVATIPSQNIPQKTETSLVAPLKITFTDSTIQHVVLDHETLYSVSKRFMVSIDDLKAINNLKSSKIKPGDTLLIPVKKEKIEPVKIRALDKLIPTNPVDTLLYFPVKKNYKVAIILPFNLEKSPGYSENVSDLATEFYMGAKLALDSLDAIGFKCEVQVLDGKNDTTSLKKVLKKLEAQTIDLIIGPLFADHIDIVAKWCKLNGTRFVVPVGLNTSSLKANPFVYAAVPSDATLMTGLANYTLRTRNKSQIILIKPPSAKDLPLYDAFRNEFLTGKFNGLRPKLVEATVENFTTFIKKGSDVIVVIPSNEKVPAIKFMNALNAAENKLTSSTIHVFGTKEWLGFEEIKPTFKNKYDFHCANTNDFNYTYEETERLHYKYRSNYNADMSKFAVQGYDVVFYFCSQLLMRTTPETMVMNRFNMRRKGQGNGYENSTSFIINHKDYQLINVDELP